MNPLEMDQMMPQAESFDDPEAVMGATEVLMGYHAKDTPQTWQDANPYLVETGVKAGTGYEMEFPQQSATPMQAPPQGGRDEARRTAMYQQLQQNNLVDDQYSDQVVEGNEQQRQAISMRGY